MPSRERLLLCVSLVLSLNGAARSDGLASTGNISGYQGVHPGYPTYLAPGVMPPPVCPFPRPTAAAAGPSVRPVVCTSDGSLLACWGPDNKTIQLWSVATGKEICQLKGPEECVSMIFAEDGKTLASADRAAIRFWDVATRKEVRCIDLKGYPKQKTLAFTPNGKVLAVSCTGTPQSLVLWDVATGEMLQQLRGHTSGVNAVVFSPDSTLLASGGDDGTIRLWDLATGKESRLGDRQGKITALAFAPDGRSLASVGEDRILRFWDMKNHKELRRVERSPYQGRIDAIAFSPDGRTVGTTGLGYLGLGQPGFGNLGGQFGLQGGQFGGQFGLQGGYPGIGYPPPPPPPSASSHRVVLWEVATGKERGSLSDAGKSVAFRPDGKALLLGIKDNKIQVQNLSGGTIALRVKNRVPPADPDSIWTDLIGEDAGKAYMAVWALAAAPDKAVPLLRERVRPAVPPVDPRLIDCWLADLESSRFDVRQRATLELEKVSRQAEQALREALKLKPSLEMTKRVERLLARLQEKGLAPEPVRVVRAIEALEQMETPEACQLLEALGRGLPGATTTEEAKAAFTRMAQRLAFP